MLWFILISLDKPWTGSDSLEQARLSLVIRFGTWWAFRCFNWTVLSVYWEHTPLWTKTPSRTTPSGGSRRFPRYVMLPELLSSDRAGLALSGHNTHPSPADTPPKKSSPSTTSIPNLDIYSLHCCSSNSLNSWPKAHPLYAYASGVLIWPCFRC